MLEPSKRRISDLLEEALLLDPIHRSDFLRRACAVDESLCSDLKSVITEWTLLGATAKLSTAPQLSDSQFADLMTLLREQGIVESERSPVPEGPGIVIGDYELLGRLGSGGMGDVYKAQQRQPVRRCVALKLLNPGMDGAEVLSRFDGERQALAAMNHRSIPKVFDAGVTETGRPYFVMELVDGVHITQYCDRERLNIPQRIELFIEVCRAVQHAHQKGIIHRDIKPSNILVTQEDGKATPKVIDFGIAKAIGQPLGNVTSLTHPGEMIGTLGYMSPEQTGLKEYDVDTRSDIYSLGAVLYELLTGATPFELAGSRAINLTQWLQRICNEEPPSPSARLSQGLKSSMDIPTLRRTSAERLPKLLRGDLDWIVMKALERDRGRRYESADALLLDLQRHLSGDPVAAGPPSTLYRAGRFARKHRLGLSAGATVTSSLLVGIIFSVGMTLRASRARQEAQAVTSFLQNDLLAYASASKQSTGGQKADPDIRVRTVLDRAAAGIRGRFDSQPQVEAAIRETIGNTYNDLGLSSEAAVQLERAADIRSRTLGSDHPDTLSAMHGLASAYLLQGKYSQAQELLTRILERRGRVLGPEHPDTLTTLDKLAQSLAYQGKYPEAEVLFLQVLEKRRRVLGPEHPDTLRAMSNLASVYNSEAKYSQARELFSRALAGQLRVVGPEHPITLTLMGNVAQMAMNDGKYPEAEELYAQVLEKRRRVLGPEHPDTLHSSYNLGTVYAKQGKFSQAEKLFSNLLERQRRILGPEHPESQATTYYLASVYEEEGLYPQSAELFSQLLEIERRVLGAEHPRTLGTMDSLGETYQDQGKYQLADELFSQILPVQQRVQGPDRPSTLIVLEDLAEVTRNQRNFPRAEGLFADVLERRRNVLGPEHPDTLYTLDNLAELYRAEGKYVESRTLLAEILEKRQRVLGAEHLDTLRTLNSLAFVDQLLGTHADQEPALRRGLAAFLLKYPDRWERYRCASLLGTNLAAKRKYVEAETLLLASYQEMLQRRAGIPAPKRFHLQAAGESIVQMYQGWGKPDKAAEWREKLTLASGR